MIVKNVDAETRTDPIPAIPIVEHRVPEWVMPVVRVAVVAVDASLAAGAFLAAFTLRGSGPTLSETAVAWSQSFVPYAGILYFTIPVTVLMLAYQRVYRFYGAFSYTQEAIKVFKAVLISSLLIVAWAFLFRGGYSFREFSYSRGVFLLDFAIALVSFTAFHLLLRVGQSAVRERDINLIPTLVVGGGAEASRIIDELRERRYLGYRLIGTVSSEHLTHADVPDLGSVEDLAGLIRRYRIQEVIITDESFDSDLLFDAMLGAGRSHKVEFRFAPSVLNLIPQKTSVEQIGVLPMVRLFTEPLTDVQRFVKRTSDIVIALLALVVTSPFWLVISILIRRDSAGSVFFRQERVGMDGRVFLCLKFRTMTHNADERLHQESYRHNIAGNIAEAENGKHSFGKVPNDPRVTRIGRWLRRTSLDELPQLINVLRGDMSIVGPRPPIPYEVREYDIWHRKRLEMKPGITGLWQVSGRNRLSFNDMVKLDLFYIENWSVLLDLKIILLTIPALWRDDGAV
jgi:exopolysaccharide biosynthesis polyprenyl glycosylphosphotransferase